MATEYMNLSLPVPSTTVGPLWASMIITALTSIDSHDHSTGQGAKITPAGLEIDDDLDFDDNTLLNVGSLRLSDALSVLASPSDIGCLYRVGENLYYNNNSGASIQLTSGTSVNAPGSGEITTSTPVSYPYSVTSGDAQKVLLIDTGTAARTLNLPAATTAMFFIVKDKDGSASSNNISVVPNGSDEIDGANSTKTLSTASGTWRFVSDGISQWYSL